MAEHDPVRPLASKKNPSHVKDLTPDPKNARKHSPRNVGMIVDALQEVGAARSIVIDEAGTILAGNATAEAAAEAGITKVHVVDADGQTLVAVRRKGLTKGQKARLALFDNRAAELADGWNIDVLKALQADGVDLSNLWRDDELAELLGTEPKQGQTDPDAVPKLRATDIKLGDLFQLGQHRLLCGDSTRADEVARLMDAAKPSLMVTDPPYGVKYDGGSSNRIKREKLLGDESPDLYAPSMDMASRVLSDAAAVYLWHSGRWADVVYAAVAIAGFEVRSQIIWNKLSPHYGALGAHYKQRHEPCLYAVRGEAKWIGPSNEPSVWDIEQARLNEYHPTQKPVECMMRPMRNHDSPLVYDPFCGSGSSIVGAEQISRSCYGVELEPSYCQVIIDRWEAFTGQKAQKVGEVGSG